MTTVTLYNAKTAPEAARPFYANGDPGPIASSLAHIPDIMEKALPFILSVFGPSKIDARTKEIVVLRASALQECKYCTGTHSFIARNAGLSRDEVIALRSEADGTSAFKDGRERALLRWTNAVAVGPQPISDELKKELRQHFSEAEIVELTLLVGATVMLNRYATALDLPVAAAHLEFLKADGLVS